MQSINIFLFILRRYHQFDVSKLSSLTGIKEDEINKIEENKLVITNEIISLYSKNLHFSDKYFHFFSKKNKLAAYLSRLLLIFFS